LYRSIPPHPVRPVQLAFFITFMTMPVMILASVVWDRAGLPRWTVLNRRKSRDARRERVRRRAGKSILSAGDVSGWGIVCPSANRPRG